MLITILGVFWALLIGLCVGSLARLILPGDQDLSLPQTAILGAVGCVIGDQIGCFIGMSNSWLLAIGSSILVLVVCSYLHRKFWT